MSASLWQRLLHGSVRLFCQRDWPRFAGPDWTERIMTVPLTDRFHAKQGRSTGRWVLQTEGESLAVYLKRHHRLPRLHGLLATLWPGRAWSPALREWQHLNWAQSQGLPVPRAIAGGEFIGPWGRLRSFLAIEELTGMLPLHEAIPAAQAALAPEHFQRWKRTLTAEIARLTRELHQRCYFHQDLYLCHFFITASDTERLPQWQGRVYLIDLHRLVHHRWRGLVWQAKDLAQLLYSSAVAGVDARDRVRFWKMYSGDKRRGLVNTLLRWLVLAKWHRYRRHNERRTDTPLCPPFARGERGG